MVAYYARNLGAHQNFTKHCWNGVIQTRLASMTKVWPLLRASFSPYAQWPIRFKLSRFWHGLEHCMGFSVVHLGSAHYKALRSGAMRGLKSRQKRELIRNSIWLPMPSWQTRRHGPIFQTIRDARELGGFERMEKSLGFICDIP